MSDLVELQNLLDAATPGPYRAHDHNDMARVGEDPEKWIGYAWVGRITKDSTPDGRWDAGWLKLDRRKDACKEYRERASPDAHFVAAALNALPSLLDALKTKNARIAELERALRPFAEDAERWADSVPNKHRSKCFEPGAKFAHPGSETAFNVGHLRTASSILKEREGG